MGKDTIETVEEASQALPGVRSSVAYQKAEALCVVPEGDISEELEGLGMEADLRITADKSELYRKPAAAWF